MKFRNPEILTALTAAAFAAAALLPQDAPRGEVIEHGESMKGAEVKTSDATDVANLTVEAIKNCEEVGAQSGNREAWPCRFMDSGANLCISRSETVRRKSTVDCLTGEIGKGACSELKAGVYEKVRTLLVNIKMGGSLDVQDTDAAEQIGQRAYAGCVGSLRKAAGLSPETPEKAAQ